MEGQKAGPGLGRLAQGWPWAGPGLGRPRRPEGQEGQEGGAQKPGFTGL